MAVFQWGTVPSVINLLTTQLNTLASGSICAAGPSISNTSNYQTGRLHLHIASSSLALTASSLCNIYAFSSNAGSTFPNFTSGASPVLARQNYLVGTIALFPGTLAATTLDEWLENVLFPAGTTQWALEYIGGGAGSWPASGNTLDLFPTPTVAA